MSNTINSDFIKLLKSKWNRNFSFIDEISFVLDINYDAAYRRITLKSKLSFEEAIKLSKHFKVSLNQFINNEKDDFFYIKKTKEIKTSKDLETYFIELGDALVHFKNDKTSSIFYSAKDLPIFYLLQDSILLRFKIYVWLQILEPNTINEGIPFEKFIFSNRMLKAAINTGKIYNELTISELWSYGVIDSIITQINYFYEIKLLSYRAAIAVSEDLRKLIQGIELAAQNGYRNTPNKTKYEMYHNELLILNNNIYFKSKNKNILITAYSLLTYYLIDDKDICKEHELIIEEQKKTSKLISNTGLKERILFFKPIYYKLDNLNKRIEFLKDFPLKNM